MKRIALIAAATAALAAPAFAQTSSALSAHDVIDNGGVVVSPPVQQHALPLLVMAPTTTSVAVLPSSTAVMGAGPGVVVGNQIILPGTAILDAPRHAVRNPDFQKWLRWEQSRIVGPAAM